MRANYQVRHCYQITFLVSFLGYILFARCQQLICENRNPEGHITRKTEGDGGFRLTVTGNYSNRGNYAPNDVYTVTIQGVTTRYSTQKFTEFLLVAESDKQASMGQTGLMTTGIFHIMDDFHSRFSDMCPDGVTNVNMHPKTEISVLWTAPSTLVASCITFKATVVERPHIWYKDDGQLTKRLCPETPRRLRASSRPTATQLHLVNPPQPNLAHLGQPENEKIVVPDRKVRRNHGMIKNDTSATPSNGQHRKIHNVMSHKPTPQSVKSVSETNKSTLPMSTLPSTPTPQPVLQTTTAPTSPPPKIEEKCCACDDAKYEIRFEGIWSKQTHPKDFPENEWLLHFSDIIGASHSPNYTVWKSGDVASEGIRHVAEWGATRHLEIELKSKSRFINTIIKAKGLWHPDERGVTSAAFRVDKSHHLVSLVSMIGPSPDWLVGITSFDLCLPNCTWMDEADFDLYPYDAGTDSGITYMSPNTPTEPREPIRPLTSSDPDDPASPFHGIPQPMMPFAKAQIRRQRIFPKSCSESSTSLDDAHEIYLTENSDDISRPECAVSDWTSWSDCSVTCGKGLRMRKRLYLIPMKADMFRCDRQLVEKEMCLGEEQPCASENTSIFEEFESICAVTPWADWTPCSETCGKGTRTRSRRYKNHLGRKRCNLETTESEMCIISLECKASVNVTEVVEKCPMTPWSEWTPCSVSCGVGIRERTRFTLLTDEEEIEQHCGGITTSQRATCTGEFGISCSISREEAKDICSLSVDVGSCRSNQTKFYYNMEKSMCVPFEWSGCKGNRNRFESMDACNDVCGFLRSVWSLQSSLELSVNPPLTVTENSLTTSTTTATLAPTSTTPVPTTHTPPSTFEPTTEPPTTKATTITTTSVTTTVTTSLTIPTQPTTVASEPPPVDTSDLDGEDEEDIKPNKLVSTKIPESNTDSEATSESTSIDCVVSRWSQWSQCSVTCGLGIKIRSRAVLIQPQNNGKLCPRLQKRKSCRLDPC